MLGHSSRGSGEGVEGWGLMGLKVVLGLEDDAQANLIYFAKGHHFLGNKLKK